MQRGFATILIVLTVLIGLGLLGSGGYYFYQQQKLKKITDFDSCAKYYPVLLSYPGQCNTPDGRHFVQELTEEEKKKLVPPIISSTDSKLNDNVVKWKTYKNEEFGFEVKYPENYKNIALQSTGQEMKEEVASYKLDGSNFLTINVFKDKFDKYKLMDQPGGAIYRFDGTNSKWVIDSTGEVIDSAPKKVENLLEVYGYHTGDGRCSLSFFVIPHTSHIYVVEIIRLSCATEEGGGNKESSDKLNMDQLLTTFKFLH